MKVIGDMKQTVHVAVEPFNRGLRDTIAVIAGRRTKSVFEGGLGNVWDDSPRET